MNKAAGDPFYTPVNNMSNPSKMKPEGSTCLASMPSYRLFMGNTTLHRLSLA
ncbi:hypothetical protein PALI_a2247 [Pseudoalteromonas aliena SW19]|uniref:Uncharacterized protein n=1 Tax=Pseudoalteromonas aliena SW19 TaxID=1314866 RepID=A0ABR9E111_9GAMM|nr:hypothetical protein [Pseudoalteromonas aliena SW19]